MHAYPDAPAGWEDLAKMFVNAKTADGEKLLAHYDSLASDGTPFPDGRMCTKDTWDHPLIRR